MYMYLSIYKLLNIFTYFQKKDLHCEDQLANEKNLATLKSYFAKESHDKDVVKKLIELSWRVRREEIQKNQVTYWIFKIGTLT